MLEGNCNCVTYLIGFSYSTIVGGFFVWIIMRSMWAILQKQAEDPTKDFLYPNQWQTITLGILERILYIVSFQMNLPEFIAIWLTLKTVSQSRSWSKGDIGRGIYNNFLVGNALSLMFAIASYGYIYLADISRKSFALAIYSLIGPVILSLFFISFFYIILQRTLRKKLTS